MKLSGANELNMSMYKIDGWEVVSCILPSITSEQEYYCDVNYATSRGDHYVCIFSGAGDGEYKIRGRPSPVEECGFYGKPVRDETA